MPSTFSVLLFFIAVASFAGFGLYSLFYFYRRWKNPSKYLKRWDADACTIVLTSGIVYFPLWISELLIRYFELPSEQKPLFIDGLSGPNGFWMWLPPVFYLAVSQLLWIEKVKEWLPARLLVSVILSIGFTRFINAIGYAKPTFAFGWEMKPEYDASGNVIVDYLLKTIVFVALITAVYYLRNRSK